MLAKHIAELPSISGYKLGAIETECISDTYFDTIKESLRKKRELALRIREKKGEYWITLKGPSQHDGTATVERDEDERKWSDDALRSIVNQLRNTENIMEIQSANNNFDPEKPADTLKAIGLERDSET